MSEPSPPSLPTPSEVEVARERTKQASHVVAIATTTGVCGAGVLFFQPTWPVAVGVAALAAMAAVICYFVVTRP